MENILAQIAQLRAELDKIRVQGNESVMAAATCYLLCDSIADSLHRVGVEKEGDAHGAGD